MSAELKTRLRWLMGRLSKASSLVHSPTPDALERLVENLKEISKACNDLALQLAQKVKANPVKEHEWM